jgi:hypothetical protein
MPQRNAKSHSTQKTALTPAQQRRLKSYQKDSGLIAMTDNTIFEPVGAIAGVSGRWDRDAALALFIAKNYELAEPTWSARAMKAVLIPEAQATNQAAVDALITKLPATGARCRVQELLEFSWGRIGPRALLNLIKRVTVGLLSEDEQESLMNCIWNLRDLFRLRRPAASGL